MTWLALLFLVSGVLLDAVLPIYVDVLMDGPRLSCGTPLFRNADLYATNPYECGDAAARRLFAGLILITSAVVLGALARRGPVDMKSDPWDEDDAQTGMERIELDRWTEDQRTGEIRNWTEAFTGRPLLVDVASETAGDPGARFSLYLTKQGRIAYFVKRVDDAWEPGFQVVDDIDDIDPIPYDIHGLAKAELTGEPWVRKIDI